MTSFEAALGQLPQPILDKLQSMIRRVRRLLFIRGLFATLAVALVCLLAIMAVDATITLFSTTSRWILSLAGLAATMVAAWWFLVRPLSRRFTLTKMARILEIRHPELQERISTAVELLASEDPDSIRGSQELISAVVDSAVDDVATVDPKTEFKPARSKKFMVATAVCGGIIALLLAVWPQQAWTLLTRALAPFLDIGNAYADTLVVDPGDVRVAKGEPVTIQVSVKHKRLKRAEIRRQMPDGTESVERMALIAEEPDGTKRFSLTFPAVEEGFDYRVRAGAALSRYFDVTAVEPPTVTNLAVKYDFPEYTGLPDAGGPTETGEIRAVAHTRVTVTATLNKPAWSAKLVVNETPSAAEPVIAENQATWEFELKNGMRGSWHLDLADEEGFKNQPSSYPIEVLPDKAPIVQIVSPTQRDISLKPTERLPIDLSVVEDFGFADVVLMATPDGAVAPTQLVQPSPAGTNRPGNYAAQALLDLPALKLTPDQRRIAVQVRVRDNRPEEFDGPGVGLSEVIFVTIDQNAKSLADQAIEAQKKEVDQQIREARQELEKARDDLRRAEQELIREKEVNSQAKENLDEFTKRNETAREKLEQVAATLDTPLFQEQSQQAAKLANEPLAKAQEKADMIPMTDAQHERVAEAKEARAEVEEAIKGLDDLAKSMREAEEDYQSISKLNELANKQQELAMKAEDWQKRAAEEAAKAQQAAQQAPNEQAKQQAMQQFDQQQQREAQQFQAEQNRVEQQLGEMLKENAAALAEVLEQQRAQSDDLAEQAEALAKQQESLRDASREATDKNENQEEALREALVEQLAQLQSELAQQAKAAAAEAKEASVPGENGEPQAPNAHPAQAQAKADPQPQAPAEGQPATPEAQAKAAEAQAKAAEALAQAAEKASQAAENLAEKKLDPASEAASEASETLAEAATQEDAATEAAQPTAAQTNPEGAQPPPSPTNPEAAQSPQNMAQQPGQPQGENAQPGEPAGETPASPRAAELAERQEALAEQIEAVKEGRLQEALAQMESMLQADAAALEAQAAGMQDSLQNLQQQQATSRAREAAQSLDRGEQEASQSAQQLARAQEQQAQAEAQGQVAEGQLAQQARATMQQGQRNQQQSAEALAQAAKAFAKSSESIGQTLEGLQPSDMDERLTNSEDLAEGFEDVAQSSQSQNAQEASQQAQEAAQSLSQLAQAAMQKLGGQPGQPGQPKPNGPNQPQPDQDLTGEPDSLDLNETGKKTADMDGSGLPPELRNLGISAEDWARFKGALAGGNATAIETDLPAEYRELVGRYFQVIAKEAGKGK
jgi:hypothetical protein